MGLIIGETFMKQQKRLTQVEWEIMEGVWQSSTPVTAREVLTRLYSHGEKAYTTVQTIMNILVDKGFLTKEKIGMVNFYAPTLSREEATRAEARSLVSRLFQGSFGALATYLIDSGELSPAELDRLRSRIDEKDRE